MGVAGSDDAAKTATAPFDDAAADTVLRTSDGVDFYVYRIILSLGSPFFRSMFSLKQPESPSASATASQGQPVIDVQESSGTLDKLLRLCYPIPDPVIQSIGEVGDVLEAALKYEMEQPTALMKNLLRTGSADQPLQAYVVACRLSMEEEAAAAASIWRVNMPFIPETPVGRNGPADWSRTMAGQAYIEPMTQITAGAFFRLLRFSRFNDVHLFCDPDRGDEEPAFAFHTVTPTPLPAFSDEKADTVIRSSDGVDFPVHRLIISFASKLLDNGTHLPSSSKSLPVFQVNEHSEVLDLAIQLCYPMEDPPIHSEELVVQLLRYAITHQARRAKDYVRRSLSSLLDIHPLRIFFIAARQGWEAEARGSVMRLLHTNIDTLYVPEMEQVSAKVYRAFLKYHYECCRKVAEIAFRETGAASFIAKSSAIPRPAEGYARVAPTIHSLTVSHAVNILTRAPHHVAYNLDIMKNESERIMGDIETAIGEVSKRFLCYIP